MNRRNLWAPWRLAYLQDLEAQVESLRATPDDAESDFLDGYWKQPDKDEENHVVYRDGRGMILLNRYPYANGHLLAALGEARPTLLEYDASGRAAFWGLVETAMDLVKRTLHPQGINVGINEGRAAGAGLPGHVHAHILPRWGGDTNFLTTVGQVRVIPDSLERMATRYREVLAESG